MADKLYDYLSKLRDYATVVWPLAQVGPIAEADVAGLVSDLATINTALSAKLVKASNLSDLADASAARTNLGLGTAATQASGTFAAASHTHAESDVTGLVADLALKAPLASPTFTSGINGDNLTLTSGAANGIIVNCTLSSGSSFIVWRRSGSNKFIENLTGTSNNLAWTNSVTTRLHMQFSAAGGTIVGNATDAIGFYGGAGGTKQTVSGAKGSNAALGSLLTALAALGLITDSTSA